MQEQATRPQTLRVATDYRPALLWLMGELGQAQTSEAIAEFEHRLGDLIPREHRERNRSGRIKWEWYVRWARQDLVNAGLMGSGGRGIWTITGAGRKWLQDHPDGGKDEILALSRDKSASRKRKPRNVQERSQPQQIRLAGEVFTLSRTDVLNAVRATLANGVPPEAERFVSWFLPVDERRVSVKWVVSLVTGLPRDRFTSGQARQQLSKLGLEAQPVDQTSVAVSPADKTLPQSAELARGAFYQAVLARLEDKLPPSVFNRRFNPQGNFLKLTCPAPTTHYELAMQRDHTEIALHFEGRRERNLALLDQFRPHLESLQGQLHEPIYAEPWGKNRARVYLKRPPLRLDKPTASVVADDWLRFIEATLPIVKKAIADLGLRVRPGRSSATVKEQELDRPQAILAQTIRDIRAYLSGDGALAPSDEKLCNWIQFCYTFEFFAEGAALFKLVRRDAVRAWLYERTQKLARACEVRLKQ